MTDVELRDMVAKLVHAHALDRHYVVVTHVFMSYTPFLFIVPHADRLIARTERLAELLCADLPDRCANIRCFSFLVRSTPPACSRVERRVLLAWESLSRPAAMASANYTVLYEAAAYWVPAVQIVEMSEFGFEGADLVAVAELDPARGDASESGQLAFPLKNVGMLFSDLTRNSKMKGAS